MAVPLSAATTTFIATSDDPSSLATVPLSAIVDDDPSSLAAVPLSATATTSIVTSDLPTSAIVDDVPTTLTASPISSSSISVPTPFSTSSRISTASRISTSSPVSTSSSLPASTLPASSTSVSSTINPTSPTPVPGGLSTSAKIGIGLGVPLGVIVLAIVALLGYLYGKRRGKERNAVSAADEQFHGFPGDKDPSAMQGQDGAGAVGPQQSDDDGGLPRYAEELQGSPGVKRHELPAQREATAYFSPDVVTS